MKLVTFILFNLLSLFFCLNAAWATETCYLGQWKWVMPIDDEAHWEAPNSDLLTGLIDLRSIPQMSRRGGVPQGHGVFCYRTATVSPSLTKVLGGIGDVVNISDRNAIETQLGLSKNISASDVRELIWELLTQHADPTGQTRWKPIMPGRDLKMRLYLGSQGLIKTVKLIPFESPEWPSVLAVLHETYRYISQEEPIVMAKMLDTWERKYSVSYEAFIPENAPIQLASLPHGTTFTESFNQADSTTLGPDLTWTETSGDLQTISNHLEEVGQNGFGEARAEVDVSSVDHATQTDHLSTSGANDDDECRPLIRFNASARTHYGFQGAGTSSVGNSLFKRVTGSFTIIGAIDESDTRNTTIKIQADGSTLKTFIDAVENEELTDTSITVNTRGGLAARNVGECDNFQVADLAAAARRVWMP